MNLRYSTKTFSTLYTGYRLASNITSFSWVIPLCFLGYSIEAIREERVLQVYYYQIWIKQWTYINTHYEIRDTECMQRAKIAILT